MENYHQYHDLTRRPVQEEEEEEEEALSLCDLPITCSSPRSKTIPADQHMINNNSQKPPSPSTPPSDPAAEFFEFLTNLNSSSEIQCSADEVIFSGQLLPFAPPRQRRQASGYSSTSTASSSSSTSSRSSSSSASLGTQSRRSYESHREFNKITSSFRCNSSTATAIRPSRSLEYRKLNRINSISSCNGDQSSRTSESKPSDRVKSRLEKSSSLSLESKIDPKGFMEDDDKLPWWLMLGLVRYPNPTTTTDQAEIQSTMKNRAQATMRNNPAALKFPAAPSVLLEKTVTYSGDDNDRHRIRSRAEKQKRKETIPKAMPTTASKNNSSWRVLNVLSCKSHASIAVTRSSFPSIATKLN